MCHMVQRNKISAWTVDDKKSAKCYNHLFTYMSFYIFQTKYSMTSWIDAHEISRNCFFSSTVISLDSVLERPRVAKVMNLSEDRGREQQISFIKSEYEHDHRAQQKCYSCDYTSTFTITSRRIFTTSELEEQRRGNASLSLNAIGALIQLSSACSIFSISSSHWSSLLSDSVTTSYSCSSCCNSFSQSVASDSAASHQKYEQTVTLKPNHFITKDKTG